MLFNIHFKIPIILVISIILILIIRIILKKSSTGYYESLDEFFKKESNANFTSKPFESLNLNFINISEKDFPFRDYDNVDENKYLIKKQNIVQKKLTLKMIKLDKLYSNTELKEIYGVNNFDKISLYEDHFKSFILALYDWAKELYLNDNLNDAKSILLKALELEQNIGKIYTILGDIYKSENDNESILKLIDKVNSSSVPIKNKTIDYLKNLF